MFRVLKCLVQLQPRGLGYPKDAPKHPQRTQPQKPSSAYLASTPSVAKPETFAAETFRKLNVGGHLADVDQVLNPVLSGFASCCIKLLCLCSKLDFLSASF